MRLGPGIEPTTDVGPMIGESYRARVEEHVADAVAQGARILVGGRRPPDKERGFFYEPTVLVDVDHSMRVMREETFGPTIPIMPLTDNYAGPFGGMKMSGLGRELGEEGVEEFWQTEHVHWDIEGGVKEYWYPY